MVLAVSLLDRAKWHSIGAVTDFLGEGRGGEHVAGSIPVQRGTHVLFQKANV